MKQTEQIRQAGDTDSPQALRLRAETAVRQGALLDLQNAPDRAEFQYRQALADFEQLLQLTGNPVYAGMARDCCTSLADLCMQQGNLHGADVYYVRAMDYGQYRKD